MTLLGTVLTSGAVGVVLVAIIGFVGTIRTLRANKPVVEATADEKVAAANLSSFNAQQGVIQTLESQLQRQDDRAEAMQKRMDEMEERLDEADHQNDQLAQSVERAEAETRLQKQYLKACRDRNQMLSNWIESHYATTQHGSDDKPPNHLLRF